MSFILAIMSFIRNESCFRNEFCRTWGTEPIQKGHGGIGQSLDAPLSGITVGRDEQNSALAIRFGLKPMCSVTYGWRGVEPSGDNAFKVGSINHMGPTRLLFSALIGAWGIFANCMVLSEEVSGGDDSRVASQSPAFKDHGAASQWSRFRGPNGTGVHEGVEVPCPWNSELFRWRVKLPARGHSSPVVSQGMVFVTSALEDDATQILQARRCEDGALVWEKRYTSQRHRLHAFNSYASSTPAVDDKRIYWAWAQPDELILVALELPTGRELWRQSLGPFKAEHGFGASPVVAGDLVIMVNEQDGESCIWALDVNDGHIRWRTPRRSVKTAYSTPMVLAGLYSGAVLILTSWAHGISCVELETGQPLWELPLFRYRVVASPVEVKGMIVGCCGEGGVGRKLLVIRPPRNGSGSPEIIFELTSDIPYVPTPVTAGDLVFFWSDRGVVTCLDTSSRTILWKERLGGQYFASPIRMGSQILNISRTGTVVIIRAANKYELISQFTLPEGTHATPAVSDDTLYVRTFTSLLAVPTVRIDKKIEP